MKDRDTELREELRAHLEMATADRVERGQDPRAATADAQRELGNVAQIHEAVRDAWGRRWIEYAVQDVRYALRVPAQSRLRRRRRSLPHTGHRRECRALP